MDDTPTQQTPQPDPPPPPPPTTPPPSAPGPAGLVERARNILLQPTTEWTRIDAEPATVGGLFLSYTLILALIPSLALLLGVMLLGGPLVNLVFSFFLQIAVIFYLVNVAVVAGLGFAIDALAPSFGGTKNSVQAYKVAVYSYTAVWVTGIILLLPQLMWLWLIGSFLYGAWLIWLGLPRLMRVPADKAPAYVGATIGVWVVLLVIARVIAGSLVRGPWGVGF